MWLDNSNRNIRQCYIGYIETNEILDQTHFIYQYICQYGGVHRLKKEEILSDLFCPIMKFIKM